LSDTWVAVTEGWPSATAGLGSPTGRPHAGLAAPVSAPANPRWSVSAPLAASTAAPAPLAPSRAIIP